MRARHRMLVVVALLLLPSPLPAQTAGNPSGHWQGVVDIPEMTMEIEVDIARDSRGQWVATFGQPAQKIKGLPFRSIAVDGRTVRLALKTGADASMFDGVMSEDGASIAGTVTQGSFSAAFTLKRTGEAQIAAAPKSAPIGKELEGKWAGTLDVEGTLQEVIVTMTNQPDGTSAGTVFSPQGSGVDIPIAITHTGSNVTIEVPSVGGAFTGVINEAANEIAGHWRQGPVALPLTLRPVAP